MGKMGKRKSRVHIFVFLLLVLSVFHCEYPKRFLRSILWNIGGSIDFGPRCYWNITCNMATYLTGMVQF